MIQWHCHTICKLTIWDEVTVFRSLLYLVWHFHIFKTEVRLGTFPAILQLNFKSLLHSHHAFHKFPRNRIQRATKVSSPNFASFASISPRTQSSEVHQLSSSTTLLPAHPGAASTRIPIPWKGPHWLPFAAKWNEWTHLALLRYLRLRASLQRDHWRQQLPFVANRDSDEDYQSLTPESAPFSLFRIGAPLLPLTHGIFRSSRSFTSKSLFNDATLAFSRASSAGCVDTATLRLWSNILQSFSILSAGLSFLYSRAFTISRSTANISW